jgi:hypothetical protein
MICSL